MQGLRKAFKTSSTAAEEGVPVLFRDAANTDGTIPTFYVGFINSKSGKAFSLAHEAAYKPWKRRVEDEDQVAIEKWNKISNDLWTQYMVKGWENVQDDDGQPMEFSVQACQDLLEELPIVRTRLAIASADYEKFRVSELEEAAKN